MTWFVVDDGLYSHPKVLSIPRAQRAAAIGLWVLAGTWSADKLTDGAVPDYLIDELGALPEHAEALVAVKLWRRRRGGYAFVNWSEFQRTREQVEAHRKAERDRKAAYRDRTRGTTGADPTGVPVGQVAESGTPNPIQSPSLNPDDDQSTGDLTSEHPGAGSTVHNPVQSGENPWTDADPELAAIVQGVTRHTSRSIIDIHPLQVAAIREHYLDRAKNPETVRNRARFVVTCLNREEPHVVDNFLNTGRWSA